MSIYRIPFGLAMAGATIAMAWGQSAQGQELKPFFGELHIHTAFSFDAFIFNTRATPDDAYSFGKGRPSAED